ncbi:hypothetical protein DL93DRAFT_2059593 [Clavulina sp. PMI_390]|nr:hypothetical protein DL93DRAFT_2059593 [Clavulina sp. PMI_390]
MLCWFRTGCSDRALSSLFHTCAGTRFFLIAEIDKLLKKVQEGVEIFDTVYDKMQASTNQAQKEKLELELKSQIKKLQRLRDQIKTWVSSGDIKDKTALLEHRKIIETQMEKFKACEKEMKTKAFSKDGLIAALKLDPKEKEKAETSAWLTTQVDELSRQIEQSEAEVESLQAGVSKKRGKGGNQASRLEELANLNERRKWHIGRLEIVLRLLENNSLEAEKVTDLKEHISYFVESNTDEDFEEDDTIYDELDLDEQDAAFGRVAMDDDNESEPETDADSKPAPARSPVKESRKAKSEDQKSEVHSSPVLRKSVPARIPPPILPPAPNFAAQPMSQALKAGLPQSGAPGTAGAKPALPPIRYSAVAANSTTSATTATTNGTSNGHTSTNGTSSTATVTATTSASGSTPAISSAAASSTAASTLPSNSSPAPDPSVPTPALSSSASVAAQDTAASEISIVSQTPASGLPTSESATSTAQQQAPSVTAATTTVPSAPQPPQSVPTQTPALLQQTQFPPQSQQSQPPQLLQSFQQNSNGSSPMPNPQQQSQAMQGLQQSMPLAAFPPGMLPPQQGQGMLQQGQQMQQIPSARAAGLPSSLADLVASFESAKKKGTTFPTPSTRMSNPQSMHKVLEAGFASLPQPRDTEKPKHYISKNPYATPAYYPQQPLESLDNPALYGRMDPETLFFIFYYHAGTYKQYLAARELKRQSWRFHTKYLTWFQRHSEPQAITDEYEQGVYVYFDWEGSWCQRKKSDFRFEYRYLSDD